MLIDDVTLHIQAGKGGDGCMSFRREKFVPRGGPDGGNGGWGGSVYIVGVNDIGALRQFRYKKEIKAQDGDSGKGKKRHGARGQDIELKMPIGSLVTDTLTGDVWEIQSTEDYFLIARGGRGGRGNFEFRSSDNKAPTFAEAGKLGRLRTIHVNLQFIADVGLIGLPSAGKSSLLNSLTNADVQVADYPFTTLEPHLGVCSGVVLADIPGLIEGAHAGKGLGTKFLKHIEKTSLLLHCIDISQQDLVGHYKIIRKELEAYSSKLAHKKEVVILTKTDLISDPKEAQKKAKSLAPYAQGIMTCSVLDEHSLEKLEKVIEKKIH